MSLKWRPLLCYTPATGRLVRYAPVKTRCIPGARFERNSVAVIVPPEWCCGLGDTAAWAVIERFRLTGDVPTT